MTWKVNEHEFKAVLALPGHRRYEYFIKKVADWQQVWSLADNDGWAMAGDDQGRELVPIWPHEVYASACVEGKWSDTKPRMITLSEWIEVWLPNMIRDGRMLVVFPTPLLGGVIVSPGRLKEDLSAETSLYE
jgi:hypothetical protein